MGVTLTLAIALWLAGAFVEYKIVKAIPGLAPLFKGLTGIVISIVISMTLGFFIAPAAGVAVALAATLGMATNEFTFQFFTKAAEKNAQRKEVTEKIKSVKTEHPRLFQDAIDGVKAGIATVVALVLAVLWIIGLPVRIVRWCATAFTSTKAAVAARF